MELLGLNLLSREKRLISLLDSLKGPIGLRDFQKLLFIYFQEGAFKASPTLSSRYEFVPYRYGAFSFTSYRDRKRLLDREILIQTSKKWHLTPKGRSLAQQLVTDDEKAFALKYESLRGDELAAYSYRKYPYYAINSEIKAEILKRDKDSLALIDSLRMELCEFSIISIGYEQRSIENYMNCLIRNGVSVLVDVRKNANSRRSEFRRSSLQNVCAKLHIDYVHYPDLGVELPQRENLVTDTDYETLFSQYRENVTDRQRKLLDKISSLVKKEKTIAITCYERDDHYCHRSALIDVICNIYGYENVMRI